MVQEPIESGNTGPWLADNQSRDLNIELWLAVYLVAGDSPGEGDKGEVTG